MRAHGTTLHLGHLTALVTVNCPSCHKNFLLRVALLKPPSQVLGARAYRVPGLKYAFTHAGGAGFLIKKMCIIGSFMWGTHTCECPKLKDVEILIHDLPLPRPNDYEYGKGRRKA